MTAKPSGGKLEFPKTKKEKNLHKSILRRQECNSFKPGEGKKRFLG